jgi:hypothetical protein
MQVPILPLRPLWHLGPLHPVEQFLTLFLAFGPFVVLGIVIWLRSRADAAEDAASTVEETARADQREG